MAPPADLLETFTQSQLAAILLFFMDFHGFYDFLAWMLNTGWDGMAPPAGPLETFTRSQLAAISSILMNFHGVYDFQGMGA